MSSLGALGPLPPSQRRSEAPFLPLPRGEFGKTFFWDGRLSTRSRCSSVKGKWQQMKRHSTICLMAASSGNETSGSRRTPLMVSATRVKAARSALSTWAVKMRAYPSGGGLLQSLNQVLMVTVHEAVGASSRKIKRQGTAPKRLR